MNYCLLTTAVFGMMTLNKTYICSGLVCVSVTSVIYCIILAFLHTMYTGYSIIMTIASVKNVNFMCALKDQCVELSGIDR